MKILKGAILMACIVSGFQTNAQALYTITEIGEGVENVFSYDINNYGQVVGNIDVANGDHGATTFVWDVVTGMTNLGTLGAYDSYGAAINDLSTVAGWTTDLHSNPYAFVLDADNGLLDLELPEEDHVASKIADINNTNRAAGWMRMSYEDYRAFVWDADNGLESLGTLDSAEVETMYSFATGINDSGQVTGGSTSDYGIRAFLYNPAGEMVDLGALPPSEDCLSSSFAKAINNSAQVAGFSLSANCEYHAFLSNGADPMVDLGTLGGERSQAYGINDIGKVVGYAETVNGVDHAFVYGPDSGIEDLNDLLTTPSEEITLHYAYAINNYGQILVSGKRGGEDHEYLLTPLPEYFGALDAGEIDITHQPVRVDFSHRFISPVIVAHLLTKNGWQPCVVRISAVEQTGFTIQIQEYEYLDGSHTRETVSYMVMERGNITLPDGTMIEAGTFNNSTEPQYHLLQGEFSTPPVIITSTTTKNDWQAATGRIKNITTKGFEYQLQEQEANTDGHVSETVSYIAWEPGYGKVDTIRYEVGKTNNAVTHQSQTITYGQPCLHPPIVLGDMQSTNGLDTAILAVTKSTREGLSVFIEEEASRDNESYHIRESVGYITLTQE